MFWVSLGIPAFATFTFLDFWSKKQSFGISGSIAFGLPMGVNYVNQMIASIGQLFKDDLAWLASVKNLNFTQILDVFGCCPNSGPGVLWLYISVTTRLCNFQKIGACTHTPAFHGFLVWTKSQNSTHLTFD